MEEESLKPESAQADTQKQGKKEIQGMNMTEGSLWKKVILFALPLACTGVLQQLFNAADVAVVGQFTGELGAHCMAAVGACGSLISLLVNLFIGISLGSNVVIANAIGANHQKRVRKAVVTSIWIAIIGGIGLTLLGEAIALFAITLPKYAAASTSLVFFNSLPTLFSRVDAETKVFPTVSSII